MGHTASRRTFILLFFVLGWGLGGVEIGGAAGAAERTRPGDGEKSNVDPVVNRYTTPSIEALFDQLAELQPISFDKVWRNMPDRPPQERARLALVTGAAIANGFLIVADQKTSKVEPVGRALLRFAKALGIGERLNRRSRHIIEQAQAEHWQEVRKELTHTQNEAELAMLALRDEELVHMVSLGGWLRGLEITSTAVALDYTIDRSKVLIQPELAKYFLDYLTKLPPALRSTPLIALLEKDVREVEDILSNDWAGRIRKVPYQDVARLRELAAEMNEAISQK